MAQLLGAQRTLRRLLHETTAKDMNFDENTHTARSLLMDQPLGTHRSLRFRQQGSMAAAYAVTCDRQQGSEAATEKATWHQSIRSQFAPYGRSFGSPQRSQGAMSALT